MSKASVVIPIFNEEHSLTELLGLIQDIFHKRLPNYDYEVVLVNDGSTDGSLSVMKELARENDKVKVVSFRKNLGKAIALSWGFRKATGDIVITLDGDLQDGPENIPRLVDSLENGSDLVVGWRRHRQDRWEKIWSSKIFNFFLTWISQVPVHDFNCGLKAMKKQVAKELNLYGELHRFTPVLVSQRNYRVSEVEVSHHERKYGLSKYGWGKLPQGFFDLLTVIFLTKFSQRPFHLFAALGSICIFIGVVLGTYLSILHFRGESISQRPLLIFAVLLILAGLQLLCIGLVAAMITDRSANIKQVPLDYESK